MQLFAFLARLFVHYRLFDIPTSSDPRRHSIRAPTYIETYEYSYSYDTWNPIVPVVCCWTVSYTRVSHIYSSHQSYEYSNCKPTRKQSHSRTVHQSAAVAAVCSPVVQNHLPSPPAQSEHAKMDDEVVHPTLNAQQLLRWRRFIVCIYHSYIRLLV